jgi:class 3 adenylate cyclase
MSGYSVAQVARRAGVGDDYVRELVNLGLLKADARGVFSEGDARRAACLQALNRAGVPLDALAAGAADGTVSLDFLDEPEFERFATTSDETFAGLAERTGIPLALLGVVREVLGSPPPSPDDNVREFELAVVPFLEAATRSGFSTLSLERLLRVMGESLRRVAETESNMWYLELIAPRLAQGLRGPDLVTPEALDLSARTDSALTSVLHGQQAQAWLGNVVRAIDTQLAQAGHHRRPDRQPAICFLDITGYTRLTQEHGDSAAAELAEELGRIVQRTSASHSGKPVKWLGDGVMFYFDAPGDAVEAALEMVVEIAAAGLPPAHVGVHTGEVLFRQGDYFGQTVNVAARIADFARAGEVLVSQEVADAAAGIAAGRFAPIGPVELKGVAGPMRLLVARPRS